MEMMMMTVAGYILAVLGMVVVGALIWCEIALLVSMTSYITPAPNAESDRTSNIGCAWFIAGIIVLVIAVGIVVKGNWTWWVFW